MRGRAELPVRPAARVGSDGPGLRLSRRESWSAGRGRRGSVRAVAVRGWREGVGPLPRRDVHFALEMCVLHSRMTVGTALSSAKCTSRRPGAPRGDGRAVAAVRWRLRRTLPWARPADRGAPPGARGGAVCPNLLQRPPSHRSAGGESLIFRASSRGRSRRGAPLQQIWTSSRPGTPREPRPPQFSTGSTEVLASGARVRLWSGCRRPALGTRPAPRTYPSAFPNGGGSACSMHIPRPPRRPLPLRADPRDALERAAERSDAQRFRPRRRARRFGTGRRA